MTPLSPAALCRLIDHTLLKADATRPQIEALCREAAQYRFISVCVNPCWVALCADLLRATGVKTCTVIGFPLGAGLPSVKAAETVAAIADGATEVDMVINVGWLKSGEPGQVQNDIAAVVAAARQAAHEILVKVILETCWLTDAEKERACALSLAAGADFVKTSTGFGRAGATVADIALMHRTVGGRMGIKASGGIRDLATARAMIAAGATRLGTSSGVTLLKELESESR